MNGWKDIKISKKMYIGFGMIILLLTAIAVWAFLGISQILDNAGEVIEGNKLDASLAQKEVDHLNWMQEVNALLTDKNITELNVEMDDHQCAFGKWLYGKEREEAVSMIPSLEPILKNIEEPHRLLHESASEIKSIFRQADPMLPGLMAARANDHHVWAETIQSALLAKKTSLSVEKNPDKCELGQWLQSPEAEKIYREAGPEFQAEWDRMIAVHEQLHESAVTLEQQMKRSNTAGIAFFTNTTYPLLERTLEHLRNLKALAEDDLINMNEANRIFTEKTQPSLVGVQTILGELRSEVRSNLMTDQQMIEAAIITRQGVLIMSVIAFVIGILLAYIIARGITVPLLKGVAFAEKLSSGDLTVTVDLNQKDEIGQLADALNHMKRSLTEVVSQVIRGADNVADGSIQLSSTAQQISQGAAEQAASAEEISSSMEQMGANIEQNSDNSVQTESISREAANVVEQGGSSVLETVEAMKNISEKISIIEEIARSTNMLSLNAAIEAARAGEHGKGFAVVAAEVGKLASSSKTAANEISELAGSSVHQAIRTGELMQEIVPKIKNTADLIQEISASSKEQKSGASQVSQAINQLDTVIQQNASASEEAAAMAEELSSQAENLKQLISFFKIDASETTPLIQNGRSPAGKRKKKTEVEYNPVSGFQSQPKSQLPKEMTEIEYTASHEDSFVEF